MFWALSLLILVAAGLGVLWPLLREKSPWRTTALALLLALPLAAWWMYLGVGRPDALELPAASEATIPGADMDQLTAALRVRLAESPDDLQGWLLLGRSYKTMQRYDEALQALEAARRLAPMDPLVTVEWVEASLYASGDPNITAEMSGELERAAEQDPSLQKALWLLGIAASQNGDDAAAIAWWERLLQQVEPGSPVSASVNEQIAAARSRLGLEAPPGTFALSLDIDLSQDAATAAAEHSGDAVLFIIVRDAEQPSGPPLGARRITQPRFPLQISLSDSDSMVPQRPISSASGIEVQARLSASGQAFASPGDWQSSPVRVDPAAAGPAKLAIDQQVD